MAAVTMVGALNRALADEMLDDDSVLVFGEDVGALGGVFRVTDALQARFGTDRCFDTPLAESGIVGSSIGFALYGYRPVPEIQFDGFAHPAFEQVVTHLAKYRNRTRGRIRLPVTVRIPYGGGIGAIEQHGESPEAYWAHTPGLRVVTPGTPSDAYSLLRQAIRCDDPVIFLEPKRRYYLKEDIELPLTTAPMDKAVVRRTGDDVTLICYGPMVRTAIDAAEAAAEHGWSVEVIDLRSLSPLDEETIVDSIRKTGRGIVAHEASRSVGLGAEIAARVTEAAFYHLEAPVLRATGYDTPYPPPKLEKFWLPDVERILDRVEQSLKY
ncbi:alpha-ketoacid dehydrogenase subunit beta [Pseudonocardia eucalypti]|uniref:Alpha-ketoacid dehydrogenase subunit beta n=1 Tax=Pseudonocardia eucalypti TaxID=648755 RepID=A0ABP9PNL3_9PSEU|nr:pyruvate dehydrogenase E1 component beta subunit [Pseudonocardia eucalypti]